MSGRLFFVVSILAGISLVIASATLLLSDRASQPITHILVFALTALIASQITYILMSGIKSPTTLTISLLGFPRSGKTVYLTMLFDELQRGHEARLRFKPYGEESSERVEQNLSTLKSGKWLPPTEPGTVFFYRAIAEMPRFLFKKMFKLEVGDFAGQQFREFDPESEEWLHKTSYFRYVVHSDAVIFAIDADVVLNKPSECEQMQSAFITALNILIENKSVSARQMKLEVPLAVVIMKWDLVSESVEDFLKRLHRLMEVCTARCQQCWTFTVSSTGGVGHEGAPPSDLKPSDVTKPIVWILQKASGIMSSRSIVRAMFPSLPFDIIDYKNRDIVKKRLQQKGRP